MCSTSSIQRSKFSLIVPVFNVEKYLARCLDSILRQTDEHLEVLIVDDGSTDESWAIVQAFCKRDARIIARRETNRGVAAARNLGLEMASGQWIWFIDSDDCIADWSLQYLRSVFESHPTIDYVCFQLTPFKNASAPYFEHCGTDLKELALLENSTAQGVEAIVTHAPREACLTCYRRNFIGSQRFEAFALGEDTLFAKQLAVRAERVVVSPARLYGYYERPGSATRSPRLSTVLDYLAMCQRLLELREADSGRLEGVFSRICFELGVVDGLARVLALGAADQRREAYEQWRRFLREYLRAFGRVACNARRVQYTVNTEWQFPGVAFFYSKILIRRVAKKSLWIARALRAGRL